MATVFFINWLASRHHRISLGIQTLLQMMYPAIGWDGGGEETFERRPECENWAITVATLKELQALSRRTAAVFQLYKLYAGSCLWAARITRYSSHRNAIPGESWSTHCMHKILQDPNPQHPGSMNNVELYSVVEQRISVARLRHYTSFWSKILTVNKLHNLTQWTSCPAATDASTAPMTSSFRITSACWPPQADSLAESDVSQPDRPSNIRVVVHSPGPWR